MSAPIGIYVRVSRKGDREDDRFHSPKEQAERAIGLAVARGYEPGPVFEDIDVSGATPPLDRPAMSELLGQIDSGQLGGISAFALDRLSREPAHGDALVKRITKRGGVILTPDIPDAIDSPTGEFTFGMLLQVAKLYRAQARARFSSSIERAILAGIPVGTVPFGYRQRPDRVLEVDPETSPIVREMYARRAAGVGWTPLWQYLQEATGREWSRNTAGAMIANRIYVTGRLEYGGVVSTVDLGTIVDEPLWHAANRPTYIDPRPKRSPESRWLLTGLVRCAKCGRSMAPWVSAATRLNSKGERVANKRSRRYKCGRGCSISVAAPRLEEWVKRETFRAGDELERLAVVPDLSPLESVLTAAERRLEQVLAPEAQDALGDAWASTAKARRQERDAAALELGEARAAVGVPAANFRLRDVWDDLPTEARREALALYWKELRVGPAAKDGQPVQFVARGPLGVRELPLPMNAEQEDNGDA